MCVMNNCVGVGVEVVTTLQYLLMGGVCVMEVVHYFYFLILVLLQFFNMGLYKTE